MSDHHGPVRPSTYTVSDRDYTPPVPPPMRPGAQDAARVPSRHERTDAMAENETRDECPFRALPSHRRRALVLEALTDHGPLSRGRLIKLVGARYPQPVDNAVHQLRRDGCIERQDSDGPAVYALTQSHEAPPAEANTPEPAPPPTPPTAEPKPQPAANDQAAATTVDIDVSRLATTTDGCLLIWFGDELTELDNHTVRALRRLLELNRSLVDAYSGREAA